MKRVTVILEVLILVGLVGCGKSKEKTIVGKWKEVGGTQTIEFFKDGTVTVVDKGEPTLPGDYRFLDDNRIRMNLALFGPIIAEVSSSRDEITLTNPFGEVEKYRRAEENLYIVKARDPGENEFFRVPGLEVFKRDGTIETILLGKWEVEDGRIDFYEGDRKVRSAEISGDTMIEWLRLFRESSWGSFDEEVFGKQKGAEVIETFGKNRLWSNYKGNLTVKTREDPTEDPIAVEARLQIRKDGTFSLTEFWGGRWKVKDNVIQIFVIGESKPQEGKSEDNEIVFRKPNGAESRLIRQN